MPHTPPPRPRPPLSSAAVRARIATIGGVVLVAVTGLAYAGGWLSPDRLTPGKIVTTLGNRASDPLGHRRHHAKGVYFTGGFEANGAATVYSTSEINNSVFVASTPAEVYAFIKTQEITTITTITPPCRPAL
jgi:catalase